MRYVVVGAGTAGCIVAARLSEDPANEVVLLEGGPDRRVENREDGIRALNWISALDESQAFWPDIQATRQVGDPRRQYMRGRGVGGSGAVNAMICLPGLPSDYDRWARELGCDGWAWSDVEPWFEAMRVALTPCPTEWYTPMDRALETAGSALGLPTGADTYTPEPGVGSVYLSASRTMRQSSAEAWLDPARRRPNLTIRTDSWVDEILWDGDHAVGIQLVGGEQISADHVVLSGGTFESTAILLRSGVDNPALGRNLRDHSAASIRVLLKDEYKRNDMSVPCINVVLRTSSSVAQDDIHLLPMHGSMDGGETDALVMAAAMTVRSEGTVALDPSNPTAHPVIDLHMLTGPGDRQVMREAVRLMVDVLEGPGFAEIIDRIVVDEQGTPVDALRDDAILDDWIQRKLGDYFHACGTCRMGRPDDPAAVVDLDGALLGRSGVHVIDASVMPDVPAANTHWPTAMVAERLTARLMERDLADLTFPDVS